MACTFCLTKENKAKFTVTEKNWVHTMTLTKPQNNSCLSKGRAPFAGHLIKQTTTDLESERNHSTVRITYKHSS